MRRVRPTGALERRRKAHTENCSIPERPDPNEHTTHSLGSICMNALLHTVSIAMRVHRLPPLWPFPVGERASDTSAEQPESNLRIKSTQNSDDNRTTNVTLYVWMLNQRKNKDREKKATGKQRGGEDSNTTTENAAAASERARANEMSRSCD